MFMFMVLYFRGDYMKKMIGLVIIVFLLMLMIIIFFNKSKDNDSESTQYSSIEEYLLSSIRHKFCCQEIGGTISEKECIFKDIDGTEMTVKLEDIENYNGINYCTDEYFDRK